MSAPVTLPAEAREALATALAALDAAAQALAAVAAAQAGRTPKPHKAQAPAAQPQPSAPEPAAQPSADRAKGAGRQPLTWEDVKPDTAGMNRQEKRAANSAAYARLKAARPVADPAAPITDRQIAALSRLTGKDPARFQRLNRGQAARQIAALKAQRDSSSRTASA